MPGTLSAQYDQIINEFVICPQVKVMMCLFLHRIAYSNYIYPALVDVAYKKGILALQGCLCYWVKFSIRRWIIILCWQDRAQFWHRIPVYGLSLLTWGICEGAVWVAIWIPVHYQYLGIRLRWTCEWKIALSISLGSWIITCLPFDKTSASSKQYSVCIWSQLLEHWRYHWMT